MIPKQGICLPTEQLSFSEEGLSRFPYILCFIALYQSPKRFLANVERRKSACMKCLTSRLFVNPGDFW